MKVFKTGDGVKGVSLDVNKGELVTLLGPSGCGKTTVLRAVGGFLEPDSGDILIEGRNVLQVPPEKRPTAMVFQSYNLWPHMTVFDNLAFGLKIRKKKKEEIRAAVDKALQLVRLPGIESKMPGQLSGGQQQRVALARTLAQNPDIILADEPIASLDPVTSRVVMDDFKNINKAMNISVIMNIHHVDMALEYADRIIGIRKGEVVFDGEVSKVTPEILDHIYGGKWAEEKAALQESVAEQLPAGGSSLYV